MQYHIDVSSISTIGKTLKEAGIRTARKGEKADICVINTSRWCIAYLATVTYGAIVVPILQDFKPNDVHHIE